MYEGGNGWYATCRIQEPHCTNSVFVWPPKLHARERRRKRPLPRWCRHRELPCLWGGGGLLGRQWAAGVVEPVGDEI